VKIDEVRQKEEARLKKEEFLQKMKDAKYHYELALQKIYILGTFRKLIKIRDDKNSKADKLRLKNQKKRFLKQLRTAAQIQTFEDEQDINEMSKTAYAFYDFSMY